jgi:pimeloyl-ACP methyl ester carboxylesterase
LPRHRTRNAALAAAALSGGGIAARAARLLWRRRELNWSAPERFRQEAYLSCEVVGSGSEPVLLVHSIDGSSGYFGAAFDELADPGPLLVPDLLGFGDSPKPNLDYSLDDHVNALLTMLDQLEVSHPALVVGHSVGAILGLWMARTHPERVRAVVALAPPIVEGAGASQSKRTRSGRLGRTRSRALDGKQSPASGARRLLSGGWHLDLPLSVAGDQASARISAAYQLTLQHCVLEADPSSWFDRIDCPVDLVVPAHDPTCDLAVLSALGADHANVSLTLLPFGDHRLPLTHPDGCLAAIDRFRDATAARTAWATT